MVEFVKRADSLRQEAETFDRQLADQIRPLAYFFDGFDVDGKGAFEEKQPGDPLSNNFVFQKVIDKVCQLDLSDKDH